MDNFSDRNDIGILRDASFIRQRARAFMRRARQADIPEQYLRITRDKFKNVLCPSYHGGVSGKTELTNLVYDNPNDTLGKKFILIDGGSDAERQLAGFALLFRLILCDKWGYSVSCASFCRSVETVRPMDEFSREDRVKELKSFDVLFINEFNRTQFRPGWQAGEILDEILLWRVSNSKVTIISSIAPISKETKIMNEDSGRRMADLSIVEKSTDDVLRIRTRVV